MLFRSVTAVDQSSSQLLGTAAAYTTVETDVGDGLSTALAELKRQTGKIEYQKRLACSSAAGGLRMVAIGLVPELTAKAAKLAAEAKQPGADFAALAKSYSQDATTRAQGGDIGFVPLSQLTPEMRPVIEPLKAGEVAAPVQSTAGFHILKLVDLRAASVAPYEQVKDALRGALRTQRQELAARAYLEGLLNAGTVSIDGAALNAAFDQTAAAATGQPALAARAAP